MSDHADAADAVDIPSSEPDVPPWEEPAAATAVRPVRRNVLDQWIRRDGQPPAWEEFFDHELIREWATDVRRCMEEGAACTSWPLVGTNIVLEHDDLEEGAALLHRAACEAGLAFARAPGSIVPAIHSELLADQRVLFEDRAPLLFMLEWGSWGYGTDDDSVLFAKRLRHELQRFDPARPVLFATCTESSDAMCTDLLKVGGFDRVMAVEAPSAQFVGERFVRMLGDGVVDDGMAAAPVKAGLVLMSNFEARDAQALVALRLRRLAHREGRRVGLAELTELSIRGLQERRLPRRRPPGVLARNRTAYHEAGHACVAVIASGGANVPDYASIVPTKEFDGIVRESLAFHDAQDDFTFDNLLLRTRILLAGRAGEEMQFGALQVSAGANSDLEAATRLTFRHFAHSGFHSGMERGESSASSLAVVPGEGQRDELQHQRIHRDVRTFLANQYAQVTRMLNEHRPFLDAVAVRLLWDPVIDQAEMAELARQHGFSSAGAR